VQIRVLALVKIERQVIGAVRRFAVPDLTTTVLTMTLTALAADSPFTGGSAKDSIRRLSAVAVMLAGAVAGALLLKTSLWVPLALAAVLAAATVLLYVPAAIRLGTAPARTPKPQN